MVIVCYLGQLHGPEQETEVRSVSPGWSGDAGRLGGAGWKAGTNYSPGDEAGPVPAVLHY